MCCRGDDDGKRLHAFFKYFVQAGIAAQVTMYIESLYVDSFKAAGVDYVTGYRLWIILSNSSKVEAFLDQCQELFGEDPEDKQRSKRVRKDIDRASWESISRNDVAQVISQIYYGNSSEKLRLDYTTSSTSDGVQDDAFDSDSDDEDAAGDVDTEEQNDNSILYRIGLRYFDDQTQIHLMNEWGINDVYKQKGTYMQQDASGMTFQVQADDTDRFQLLCDEGITWIKPSANILDEFLLPHEKPSVNEVRRYLLGLTHIVGGNTTTIHKMTVRASHADRRQLDGPDAHEPATADSKAGGGDRADLERADCAGVLAEAGPRRRLLPQPAVPGHLGGCKKEAAANKHCADGREHYRVHQRDFQPRVHHEGVAAGAAAGQAGFPGGLGAVRSDCQRGQRTREEGAADADVPAQASGEHGVADAFL